MGMVDSPNGTVNDWLTDVESVANALWLYKCKDAVCLYQRLME